MKPPKFWTKGVNFMKRFVEEALQLLTVRVPKRGEGQSKVSHVSRYAYRVLERCFEIPASITFAFWADASDVIGWVFTGIGVLCACLSTTFFAMAGIGVLYGLLAGELFRHIPILQLVSLIGLVVFGYFYPFVVGIAGTVYMVVILFEQYFTYKMYLRVRCS